MITVKMLVAAVAATHVYISQLSWFFFVLESQRLSYGTDERNKIIATND